MSDKNWAMPATTPDEEERRRQIAAARRMGNTSGTSIASKPTPQAPQSVKPTRTTYKGHEALVDALKASGTVVQFEMRSGKELIGVITHFDGVTISIKKSGASVSTVLFKHDISSMTPTTPKEEKGDHQ